MASVQFFGINAVLQAAENRGCPKWAIFQGKQFLFKCELDTLEESIDFLGQILENLEQSTAVYTICFYEDAEKIKANTPHDGSFNFRTISETDRQNISAKYESGKNAIFDKLQAIEDRLIMLEQEPEDEEEESGTINGIVKGFLTEPDKLLQLIEVGKSLLGIGTRNRQAAMAGIPEQANADTISKAVALLSQADPNFAEHIQKLAKLATEQPALFKQLIKMLENF